MFLKINLVILLILGVFVSTAVSDQNTIPPNLIPDVSAYIQVRGTYGNIGPAAKTFTGDGFSIRRAKVILTGKTVDHLTYRFQFISRSDLPTPQLQDAYVEYNRFNYAQFVVGQMVPPFGRERLSPDWQIFTMEHSQISNNLVPSSQTLARDIGVEAKGDVLDKYFEYAVGLYNGTGANNLPSHNTNSNFLYVARIVGNPLKGDVQSDTPGISLGASVSYRKANGLTNLSNILNSSLPFTGTDLRYNVDGEITCHGFSFIGEYIRAILTSNEAKIKSVTSDGYYLQAAYFVTHYLQPMIEYQTFNPDTYMESTKNVKWLTAGLNYYIVGDKFKLMADYTFERFGRLEAHNTDMARVQLQVMF
jgi:phosphate-selective porin